MTLGSCPEGAGRGEGLKSVHGRVRGKHAHPQEERVRSGLDNLGLFHGGHADARRRLPAPSSWADSIADRRRLDGICAGRASPDPVCALGAPGRSDIASGGHAVRGVLSLPDRGHRARRDVLRRPLAGASDHCGLGRRRALGLCNLAETAMLPSLVQPVTMWRALAKSEGAAHFASLAGRPLGGYLFGAGSYIPFAMNTALFAVSWGLFFNLPRTVRTATRQRVAPARSVRRLSGLAEAGIPP